MSLLLLLLLHLPQVILIQDPVLETDKDYLCRKRRRKKRELMSAFIRRKLEDKVVMEDIRDGDNWSLNNVKRDVYYEE